LGTAAALTVKLRKKKPLEIAAAVTIVARRGKTTIRCTENLAGLAGASFGPIMGPGGVAGGGLASSFFMSTHHPLLGIATWLGTIGAAYGAGRMIFASNVRRRRQKLRQLVDALAREVRDSIAGG